MENIVNIQIHLEDDEMNEFVKRGINGLTVVKIDYPITKYHDGQNITTIHKNVWLCKECATKLINAVEGAKMDESGDEE